MQEIYALNNLEQAPYSVFFAIPLPTELIYQYEQLTRDLENLDLTVSFQKRESPHITLAYLGDIELEDLELVCQAGERASKFQPFEVKIESAGHFGKLNQRKVLWKEVLAPENLQSLHDTLTKELPAQYRESRTYKAHFTVARIKNSFQYSRQEKEVLKIVENYNFEFVADRIRLYGAIGDKRQIPLVDFGKSF